MGGLAWRCQLKGVISKIQIIYLIFGFVEVPCQEQDGRKVSREFGLNCIYAAGPKRNILGRPGPSWIFNFMSQCRHCDEVDTIFSHLTFLLSYWRWAWVETFVSTWAGIGWTHFFSGWPGLNRHFFTGRTPEVQPGLNFIKPGKQVYRKSQSTAEKLEDSETAGNCSEGLVDHEKCSKIV